MSERPQQPSPQLLALEKLGGYFHGIWIEQRQTGTDTADTWCRLISDGNRTLEGWWREYQPYLIVDPHHHDVIAYIDGKYERILKEWHAYEQKERHDLAEYRRLKEKFGDVR